LLWVWLYRIWPQALNAMVLVKPSTVVQWHRKGFRLYWRWRSRSRTPKRIGETHLADQIADDAPLRQDEVEPQRERKVRSSNDRLLTRGGANG
jgi:hypothetical protein